MNTPPRRNLLSKWLRISLATAGPFALPLTVQCGDLTVDNLTVNADLHALNIPSDNTERLKFIESGSQYFNPSAEPLRFNLTNSAQQRKRGMSMDILTLPGPNYMIADPSAPGGQRIRRNTDPGWVEVNSGGIAIGMFTPPDNGGEVSAFWALQTGGGNCISVYNDSDARGHLNGARLPEYRTGIGIEVGVRQEKHGVVSSAQNGAAYIGVAAHGAVNGQGGNLAAPAFAAQIQTNNNAGIDRRAFQASDAQGHESFAVQFDGKVFTKKLGVNTMPSAGDPALTVNGFIQTADAVPFSVKRYTGWTTSSGTALIPHGLGQGAGLNVLSVNAYSKGNSGEMLPMNLVYVDGSNIAVGGGQPNRSYRVTVMYTNIGHANW